MSRSIFCSVGGSFGGHDDFGGSGALYQRCPASPLRFSGKMGLAGLAAALPCQARPCCTGYGSSAPTPDSSRAGSELDDGSAFDGTAE